MSGVVLTVPSRGLTTSEEAATLSVQLACPPAAARGDLVRLDPEAEGRVLPATDNLTKEPVVGMITRKITPTRAVVALNGIVAGPILPVGKVFLSATGTLASAPPAAGYVQALGFSFGSGRIKLDPNSLVAFRAP